MINKPRDDELYHWKYVKRVRDANGKWRYYYHWDELRDDARNAIGLNQRNAYNRAVSNARVARSQRSAALANVQSGSRVNRYSTSGIRKSYSRTVSEFSQYDSRYRRAQSEVDRTLQAYRSTPLGKVAGIIDAGRNFIENHRSRPRK